MAAIPVRNFATLVGNFAAGVQGRAKELVDFSTGSVLRAVAEATADLALWLQSIIVYVLTLTRAATSKGADLDSWYADWQFFRLPAKAATGVVTFSRFSADQGVVVPVGAQVGSGDGTLIFAVYADATNPAWSADANGYVVQAGVTSLDVPVAAVMPSGAKNGSAWNVASGQINTARTTIVGMDTVANAAPFTNGIDAESDPAFQARFPLYIASLSKGTPAAIRAAVAGVQQGLQCAIVEDPLLTIVYVDDGSGAISDDLLAAVQAAVGDIRAAGPRLGVVAAQRLAADIAMIVTVDPAYRATDVVARVALAVGTFINAVGLGKPLRYTVLEHVAYGVLGVTNVSGVTLNGATFDLVAAPGQTIKAGNLVVSPGG